MPIDDRKARETEQQLAQNYLDTATLGREVAAYALEQALKEAKAGTLRDPGKTAVSAITASAIALDKRLILQERPTQIHALENPVEAGLRLLAKHGLTIDATATDITVQTGQLEAPKTQSEPLQSQRVAAKRPRTRAKPKPKPAAD
jgi:hypothetical protein